MIFWFHYWLQKFQNGRHGFPWETHSQSLLLSFTEWTEGCRMDVPEQGEEEGGVSRPWQGSLQFEALISRCPEDLSIAAVQFSCLASECGCHRTGCLHPSSSRLPIEMAFAIWRSRTGVGVLNHPEQPFMWKKRSVILGMNFHKPTEKVCWGLIFVVTAFWSVFEVYLLGTCRFVSKGLFSFEHERSLSLERQIFMQSRTIYKYWHVFW